MAVFALGIVACESCNCDVGQMNEALVPLRELLERHAALGNDANLSMLRNVTWTLSILYRVISNSHLEQVKPALKILERLLHSDDLEVLIHSCWAIHGVISGLICEIVDLMDAGLCPKLVELFLHKSHELQIPVVTTVALISYKLGRRRIGLTHIQLSLWNKVCIPYAELAFSPTNPLTCDLIDKGIVGKVLILLTEGPKAKYPMEGEVRIKREACKVIYGILLGEHSPIQTVIDDVTRANLFGPLVKLLEHPHVGVQIEIARVISIVTSHGSRNQVRHLIDDCRMITPICNLLSSQCAIAIEAALQVVNDLLEAEDPKGRFVGGAVDSYHRPYSPYDVTSLDTYPKLIVEAGCMKKLEVLKSRQRKSEIDCDMIKEAERLLMQLERLGFSL